MCIYSKIFFERLLHARPCAGPWGSSHERDRQVAGHVLEFVYHTSKASTGLYRSFFPFSVVFGANYICAEIKKDPICSVPGTVPEIQ